MRLGMRCLLSVVLCTAGCRPTFTDHLDVTVQLGTGLTSKCVKVSVRGEGVDPRSTEPMGTADKTRLRVLVHRESFPESVTLQAQGYADEGCTTLTSPAEQSPPTTAAFSQRTISLNVERGSGLDIDGDGFTPPADCNDQDPAVKPGVAERCNDGIDNNCVNGIDCAEPDCHAMACGDGARCQALTCKEDVCSDSIDGDRDGTVDCADTDCAGLACGTGAGASCMGMDCEETACSDTIDNDEDSLTDCQEPSCAGAPCGVGGTCTNLRCEEPNETVCGDGLDNDDDGRIDCADMDCGGRMCSDNNLCTTGETCAGNSCGGGVAKVCNDPRNECLQAAGSCSMATGLCVYPPAASTTVCSDGDACTAPDRCNGDGGCASAPVMCPAPPSGCFAQGICQPSLDGGCSYAVMAGLGCSDGNACTLGDACLADGGCAGMAPSCVPAECKVFTPGTCEADGGCLFTDAPVNTACAGGRCNGAGVCVPNPTFSFTPDNVVPTNHYPAVGSAVFNVDCALTFFSGPDAGFGTLCSGMMAPAVSIADGGAAGELAVISLAGLNVTDAGSITLRGDRPVVFLVWGDAGIDGPILANSSSAGPGPGALGRLGCGTRTGGDGKPASGQNGGGGGAGFFTNGGEGGNGNNVAGSGGDAGMSAAGGDVPLFVGCPGGRGKTDNSFTPGGVGGGALQLSVAGNLSVSSVLSVSGQGGIGGDEGSDPGGGGGGSGGSLVLQARQVTVTAGAKLTSNGGAGGGGAQGNTGTNGADGSTTTNTPATGGPNEGGGGSGGNGGAGATPPGNGVSAGKGGGGGGGSVGRIFIKNVGTGCTVSGSAVISPAAARTNCP